MKQLIIIFTLLFSINTFALEVPTLTGPVVDKANVLTNDATLEAQIRALYNNGQGPQINILTISSLEGDNIEQFAHKVFTTWKLGDAKRDDGVLFILSINDRKMRIEVGQGLEGGLTDLQSKRILGALKSYLREKDYSGAVQTGLSQIVKAASQPDAVQQPVQSSPSRSNSVATSSDDSGIILILMGAGILVLAYFILSRVIGGYFRRFARQMENEQDSLTRLEKQEAQALKVTQKYTDKITAVEKEHHIPMADVIKKINKEAKDLSVLCAKQNDKVDELSRKEYSCPASKLDSLKSDLRSWELKLHNSKTNISRHQSLINKEGR